MSRVSPPCAGNGRAVSLCQAGRLCLLFLSFLFSAVTRSSPQSWRRSSDWPHDRHSRREWRRSVDEATAGDSARRETKQRQQPQRSRQLRGAACLSARSPDIAAALSIPSSVHPQLLCRCSCAQGFQRSVEHHQVRLHRLWSETSRDSGDSAAATPTPSPSAGPADRVAAPTRDT